SLVPGALPRIELAGFGDCVDGRGALGDGLARRFADGDQLLGGQGRQLGGRGQVLRAEPFGARGLDLLPRVPGTGIGPPARAPVCRASPPASVVGPPHGNPLPGHFIVPLGKSPAPSTGPPPAVKTFPRVVPS